MNGGRLWINVMANKKILAAIVFWMLAIPASASFAQAFLEETDSTYINLGLISYSTDYVLQEDLSSITFKIRNNTSRSISSMFAWVYRFQESEEGVPGSFLLVNNPHRGSVTVKGGAHPPGLIREWRFEILKRRRTAQGNEEYTLRVSPKSIFYLNIEPAPPPKDPDGPRETRQ